MRKGKFTNHHVGLIALTLLFTACATQKSRYDQSGIGKIYHDVTAKYNGYFNANEIIDASILELEAQHKDNYTDILELYKYRAAPNPQAVAANLDEAIKKVSVVSTLHEASQWVDDCYLLIGKAYYLKQDFESAENALEFFMDEFNPDGTRITKKKKKLRPSKKSTAKSKAQSERERKKLAKQQERERKQYNKQLRKKKKSSNRQSGSDDATERKTARDLSPTSLEAQQRNTPEQMEPEQSGEENPGGWKHRPAHQEANLWLARIYVERENYPGVERILNGLKNNPNLQDEVHKELPVVWAYYSLRRKNYAGAIPHLKSAVEMADKKAERARLSFILGQIAEMDKNYTVAAEYYENVLKNNPDYTLDFNARLSLARVRMESGAESPQEVVAMLEKMLNDEKNEEYKDQIYFTLGQLALRQNDIPGAIANLTLAAEHGSANPTQLTETNFLLAELYFQQEDYINAKLAYDATLTTMLKTDERYRRVDRLSKNLTDIAMHLTNIQLQDSLLRISMMTDEEKRELAKKLYQPPVSPQSGSAGNVKGSQGGKAALAAMPGAQGAGRPTGGTSVLQTSFFAYDQKQVKRGQRDFEHTWGDRPLSDNWRLASLVELTGNFVDADTAGASQPTDILTDQDIAKVLGDIPDTDEKRAASHDIIQNAMLQLGSLYRDKLEDYPLSIETLESLLAKYPDTQYKLDALYQLYLSHLALEDFARAEYYKNMIIEDFAASKYAMVLIDPDYMSKQLTEEQRLDRDYQEVYDLVQKGNFEQARTRIEEAKATFGTSHALQAKYSILEAMCIGNLEGREAYIDALKAVIGGYPGTPEEIKARDMLLLLDAYQGSKLNLKTASEPDFKLSMDAQHFVLIQVAGYKDADAQDVKVSISNYNRKYHSLDKLKISSLRFDAQGDQVIILVRSFKDGTAAMKYLDGISKNQNEFVPTGTNYDIFAVTQQNYREIVAQKSVESYRPFFEENYRS